MSENKKYSKVAEKIHFYRDKINELLANVELESEVVKNEDKITNFLTSDADDLVGEAFSGYYNLDQVKNIFDMLQPSEPKKRAKLLTRTESTISLGSISTTSLDCAQGIDNSSDVKNNISVIRNILEGIKNKALKDVDLMDINDKETARQITFQELIMMLQKLAKELQSIASSDVSNSTFKAPAINNDLIEDLNKLTQTLTNIQTCGKNPISEELKQGNCSFELTSVINALLETIEKNPL